MVRLLRWWLWIIWIGSIPRLYVHHIDLRLNDYVHLILNRAPIVVLKSRSRRCVVCSPREAQSSGGQLQRNPGTSSLPLPLSSSFSFSLIIHCEPTIYRYINKFIKNGFQVEALAIRESGTKEPIDRVNMVCRSLFGRLSVEF